MNNRTGSYVPKSRIEKITTTLGKTIGGDKIKDGNFISETPIRGRKSSSNNEDYLLKSEIRSIKTTDGRLIKQKFIKDGNFLKNSSIKHPKVVRTQFEDEDFEYAKGGGVRKSLFNNREYSYGRNWTNDHRHQNKREDYEVPMSDRKRKYAVGGSVNMNKHIWEGWTVGSFVNDLEPTFNQIMTGGSWQKPFTTREEVKRWAMDNQPYYKKYIPEVVDYFWAKSQNKNNYYAGGGEIPADEQAKIDKLEKFINNPVYQKEQPQTIEEYRGFVDSIKARYSTSTKEETKVEPKVEPKATTIPTPKTKTTAPAKPKATAKDKESNKEELKSWYIKNYPTDELGEEMLDENTFEDLFNTLKNKIDVYSLFGVGDSVIRERLFERLAEIEGVKYSYIYDLWMQGDDSDIKISKPTAKPRATATAPAKPKATTTTATPKTKVTTRSKSEVVADKIMEIYNDALDGLKVSSGSEVYQSIDIQEKLKKILDEKITDKSFSSEVGDVLTDENYHSLKNYLALKGLLGKDSEKEYIEYFNKYKSKGFWNPSVFGIKVEEKTTTTATSKPKVTATATAKPKVTTTAPAKPKVTATAPAKPKAIAETKISRGVKVTGSSMVNVEGKEMDMNSAEFCDYLLKKFRDRREKSKNAPKKKTASVMAKITANVEKSVVQAIKSSVESNKKAIEKNPNFFVKKVEKLETSTKSFLQSMKDVLGDDFKEGEIATTMKHIEELTESLIAKYKTK